MSKIKYTEQENEINKVLKMNQDVSTSLVNNAELKKTRKSADENIAASLELLRSLGKGDEADEAMKSARKKSIAVSSSFKPEIEPFEEIAAQANEYCPNPVSLEDIMTEQEIESAFNELDEINRRFSAKTNIVNKTDLAFLSIATALQVTKSLVFPLVAEKFDYGKNSDQLKKERLNHNDESIEKEHRKANDGFKEKYIEKHGKGHWINILYQTVPYDTTKGSPAIGKNMGGRYHRMYTLGHDPILGWLFGTANILTDCITFNNFQTNRVIRVDPITGGKKMSITGEKVSFSQMIDECRQDIKADFLNLPAAIFAQAQHLKSDKYTKTGLPVPLLSSFNEEFAGKLYREHYDALCFSRDIKIVGASFIVSKLVDIIISLTHGLFKKPEENRNLYEVRTRKILLISNSIASASMVINAAITSNPKNLDIGSLFSTVTHLFSDIRFIAKIKQEFVENEISLRLKNELDEIDALYDSM